MTRRHRTTDEILSQADGDIEYRLRTARIDLDAFLALSGEERAARWRGWDRDAKLQAVQQMLTRKYGSWDDESVALAIATYDAKWGAAPTTVESAVLAAIDDLQAQAERGAAEARDASEALYFAAEVRAFDRARAMYRDGCRPEQRAGGDWTVASASGAGAYTVTRGGACDCKAGQRALRCKHVALIAAIETGLDNLNTFDDPDPEYLAAARRVLGARLARARAQHLAEVA